MESTKRQVRRGEAKSKIINHKFEIISHHRSELSAAADCRESERDGSANHLFRMAAGCRVP